MKLKEYQKETLRFIGNHLLFFAVTLLCKTLKVTVENDRMVGELQKKGTHFILAFWHGTMFYPWFYHRNQGFLGLTSQSKDGDLLAKLLQKWNYRVMRGSSSKGGEIALGIMVDYAKFDGSVAITPDGPRGPRHKLKAGVVVSAKKSGAPVILLGVGYSNKYKLKNWDAFEIPKLFSTVKLVYSDPINIDKDLDYDGTSKKIDWCETKLNELQLMAEQVN